jgi:hypothetical protein
MANELRLIATQKLAQVLGLQAAANLLDVEADELKEGSRYPCAEVIAWFLEIQGGYSSCDEFNNWVLARESLFNAIQTECLEDFIREGDPLIAWIGTNDMLVAGLAVAYWDTVEEGSDRETIQRIVDWSTGLGVPTRHVWPILSRFFHAEDIQAIQFQLLRIVRANQVWNDVQIYAMGFSNTNSNSIQTQWTLAHREVAEHLEICTAEVGAP